MKLVLLLALMLSISPGMLTAQEDSAAALGSSDAVQAETSELDTGTAALDLKPIEATITLKDGQVAQGVIASFDDYFIVFETLSGIKSNIPWREIGMIEEKEVSGASAFFGSRMVEGDAKVESILAPLSEGKARMQALLAGFFVHGWGHRYARDNSAFLSLAGAGAFGLLVSAIGGVEFIDPGSANNDKKISTAMVSTGAVFFVGSWLWDIAFAPSAVRKFNKAKGLALLPSDQGLVLSLNMEF